MPIYDITPVPKPRMTRSDRWKKRDCVMRYWAYKDEVRLKKVAVNNGDKITFILPMPKSWSAVKKAKMKGMPHQQTPDKDNLEKALLDAIYGQDKHIYDTSSKKFWGYEGMIIVEAA